MNRRWTKYLLLWLALASACAGKRDRRVLEIDPETPAIDWDELIDMTTMILQQLETPLAAVPSPPVGQLPPPRHQGHLAHLAAQHQIERPQFYAGGVYGKKDNAVFYVTTRAQVPDWDKLYQVMVRVLSEKYGCFMRTKFKKGNYMTFGCKDGREIAFWRSLADDRIQFLARQYDRLGREINVQH